MRSCDRIKGRALAQVSGARQSVKFDAYPGTIGATVKHNVPVVNGEKAVSNKNMCYDWYLITDATVQ